MGIKGCVAGKVLAGGGGGVYWNETATQEGERSGYGG